MLVKELDAFLNDLFELSEYSLTKRRNFLCFQVLRTKLILLITTVEKVTDL